MLILITRTSKLYLLLFFLLLATFASWGYNFGRGDHSEIIPYAYYLNGKWQDNFPLFLENIISYFPNERFATAFLISLFGEYIPIAVLILHIMTTYFLMLGIFRIANIFLKDGLAFCVVWLLMLPLWGINFGGNELYYNNFQASTISKSIAVWAIYFYLKNQFSKSFYLFTLSTLFHLLAGLQIGFLFLIIYFITNFYDSKKIPRLYFSQWLFIVFSLIYAISMKFSLEKDQQILSSSQYFEAMFYWKFNEHYAPLDFQKIGTILYLGSLTLGLYFFKQNRTVFWFFIFQMIGGVIYFLGFYVLQSNFITSLQWFKTSLWIKLFGIIAWMGILNQFVHKVTQKYWLYISLILSLSLVILVFKFNRIFLALGSMGVIFAIVQHRLNDFYIMIMLCFIAFSGFFRAKERVPLDVFYKDESIQFCYKIKELKEIQQVIVPIDFTYLESYAQKPAYVNFISTPKKNKFFANYLERIKEVYGLIPKCSPIKKEIETAKSFYNKKDWNYWSKFKENRVTHIITENVRFEGKNPVLSLGKWYLWEL